jgi:hypothetical protein
MKQLRQHHTAVVVQVLMPDPELQSCITHIYTARLTNEHNTDSIRFIFLQYNVKVSRNRHVGKCRNDSTRTVCRYYWKYSFNIMLGPPPPPMYRYISGKTTVVCSYSVYSMRCSENMLRKELALLILFIRLIDGRLFKIVIKHVY